MAVEIMGDKVYGLIPLRIYTRRIDEALLHPSFTHYLKICTVHNVYQGMYLYNSLDLYIT